MQRAYLSWGAAGHDAKVLTNDRLCGHIKEAACMLIGDFQHVFSSAFTASCFVEQIPRIFDPLMRTGKQTCCDGSVL